MRADGGVETDSLVPPWSFVSAFMHVVVVVVFKFLSLPLSDSSLSLSDPSTKI